MSRRTPLLASAGGVLCGMSYSHKSLSPDDPRLLIRERDLAVRWKTSCRTLQRWRAQGSGPPHILIGGAIRYRLGDVFDYEQKMRRGGDTP